MDEEEFVDIGGEWTAEWRTIHIQSAGWIRGGDVPTKIWALKKAALDADRFDAKPALLELRKASERLERELDLFVANLLRLRTATANLTAAVHQAIKLYDTPRREQRQDGLDHDEIVDRLGAFYDVP